MKAMYDNQQIEVNATPEVESLIAELGKPSRGQFAFVTGHISGLNDKGCITPHESNMLMIASPRYDRYLQRQLTAVVNMNVLTFVENMYPSRFNEIMEKAGGQTVAELFEKYKNEIVTELSEKLAGTFTSASAEAHNICYCNINGWKCHLVTEETKVDGKKRMVPVIADDGLYTAQSVILPFFCIKRWTVKNGEWKPVNSKARTLVRAEIEKQTGVTSWKVFSLQKGNFSRMAVQGAVVLNDVNHSDENYPVESVCGATDAQAIGNLPDVPMACLTHEATAQTINA